MAFNFNWSPLTADADFYRRARDLLTAALNKSPKPPIIVDDIFVTELNLGSVPPELEILEIGDLAEDRFRGIFKMCYSGDAFLTLKTRVQANPLNTYLDSKPSFTSPQPLAAAAGLTIPLSITLSEIKLSAFIILVFSKQKGLTLVFRNDPLESLKVSSTFDSIQFVRDYLQRTIEGQLRTLMMDELPAIIHRLSLQLWCPDQVPKTAEDEGVEGEQDVDPLASPPLDPVDANGNLLDEADVSRLELDGGPEVQSMFSQKNLLAGHSLRDLNNTLTMLSPGLRDVVFRAWTGGSDGGGDVTPGAATPLATPTPGSHTRSPSTSTTTTYTFSDSSSLPTRPSLVSMQSATAGLSLGAGSRSRSYGKKKKTRVVNLRRAKPDAAEPTAADETLSEPAAPTPSEDGASVQPPFSDPTLVPAIPEELDEDFSDLRTRHPARPPPSPGHMTSHHLGIDGSDGIPSPPQAVSPPRTVSFGSKEKATGLLSAGMPGIRHKAAPSDVMLDQQWIMKMAGEIARRVYDEKRRQAEGPWDERDDAPPPAYEATQ
jgi:distribution and morphology protein 34